MRKFLFGFLGLIGIVILAIVVFLFRPEKAYEAYVVSEDYQAQVDKFNLPAMPADWTWQRFEAEDGTGLRWGETGNRGSSSVTLIMVPGYTATMSMYGEHVDRLARKGYHVIGVDLRGQGGSDRHFPKQPEKLWVKDFGVYSDDLAAFITSQNFKEERTVIPMASSFGGHVGLRMAHDYPGLVDGYYFIAPAIEPKAGTTPFDDAGSQMNAAQKMKQGKRYLPGNGNWKPETPSDLSRHGIEYCSSNPLRLPNRDVIFTREPEQRVGGVTVQWGAEFFQSAVLMRDANYFDPIKVPVTIISADRDDFVSNAALDDACGKLADCQLERYPGSGHCLLQETNNVVDGMLEQVDVLVARVKAK